MNDKKKGRVTMAKNIKKESAFIGSDMKVRKGGYKSNIRNTLELYGKKTNTGE